jgi:hypothetical protein
MTGLPKHRPPQLRPRGTEPGSPDDGGIAARAVRPRAAIRAGDSLRAGPFCRERQHVSLAQGT